VIENPRVGQRVWHRVNIFAVHRATVRFAERQSATVIDYDDDPGVMYAASDRDLFATPTEADAALEAQAHQLLAQARELRETDT